MLKCMLTSPDEVHCTVLYVCSRSISVYDVNAPYRNAAVLFRLRFAILFYNPVTEIDFFNKSRDTKLYLIIAGLS